MAIVRSVETEIQMTAGPGETAITEGSVGRAERGDSAEMGTEILGVTEMIERIRTKEKRGEGAEAGFRGEILEIGTGAIGADLTETETIGIRGASEVADTEAEIGVSGGTAGTAGIVGIVEIVEIVEIAGTEVSDETKTAGEEREVFAGTMTAGETGRTDEMMIAEETGISLGETMIEGSEETMSEMVSSATADTEIVIGRIETKMAREIGRRDRGTVCPRVRISLEAETMAMTGETLLRIRTKRRILGMQKIATRRINLEPTK